MIRRGKDDRMETTEQRPGRIEPMVGYFLKLWKCHIWRFHDRTCAAAEGIPATQKQIADGVQGFYNKEKMYCKRCGAESEISRLARARAQHERPAKNGR